MLDLLCFDSLKFDVVIVRFFFRPIVKKDLIAGFKRINFIEQLIRIKKEKRESIAAQNLFMPVESE